MVTNTLILDQAVRDWVFIPLTIAITLMKLLTQFAHQLFSAPPEQKKEAVEIKEIQSVARSGRLRQCCRLIPESSFVMRRDYFAAKDTGVFVQKSKSRTVQETMATDPGVMVDMMRKQMTGMIPQFVMGWVVNFFFQGFVIGKVPFPLSPRFRPMLQRGIDLASLDVSYCTGLSFYILLLFGLRGAFSLVFREDTVDESAAMRSPMNMNPMAASPMGFDAENAFKGERTALPLIDHEWDLETAEERALSILRNSL